MTHFNVTASTLSAQDLGLYIQQKYNLDNGLNCKLFRTGINHTYLLTGNNTKYALRVYSNNWRSKVEIKEEIQLLTLLKENEISVSYPIADTNGDFIQELNAPEGVRYAVLFSFAEGSKIRDMDANACFAVGALMAKMHKLTVNQKINRIDYNYQTLLTLPYTCALEYFSEKLPEMQFIKEQSEELIPFFEQANAANMQSGIVHLDIWYDNMAVTGNNGITLFDFDFCGNGWLVFDVAYFCRQLFDIEPDKNQYELKLQSFLSGYKSVRGLSDHELKAIPKAATALWIFYLGVQCKRFDWSNVFLSENYLKLLFVARMKAWITYYETETIEM